MEERPFELQIGDGLLRGMIGGKGIPALVLHGGPGLPDYMGGCAAELGDLFTTIRYTQRGTMPTTVGGPFTIETHMADALAVLDELELDRAWAVGHSWGGHLALHLAVAHPERLYGIVCIDTLGASTEVLAEFRDNLTAGLPAEQLSRIDEIDAREAEGTATEPELLEQLSILWPYYFADPASAPPFTIEHRGIECGTETFRSIQEHFEDGTLESGLPRLRDLPCCSPTGCRIRCRSARRSTRPSSFVARRSPGSRPAGTFPGSSSRAS